MNTIKKEKAKTLPSLIFEGMTSIRSVLRATDERISDRRIRRILVADSKRKSRAKELSWLSYKSKELGFSIEVVSDEELELLTLGATHGGIIAECTERSIPQLDAVNVFNLPENGFYAMLEGIEDPYNFGNAIRSLYACGADGIILTPRNWMSAAGVVCRSSAGASEILPMYTCEASEAAELMKKIGYRIICAGIRNSVSSFDADLKKPVLLIIGGEKRGISASLLDKADQIVRIDYGREYNGSLSAASSCAMLAYEIMRNNKK